VQFVDLNGDGYTDVYAANSGPFYNNGNNVFGGNSGRPMDATVVAALYDKPGSSGHCGDGVCEGNGFSSLEETAAAGTLSCAADCKVCPAGTPCPAIWTSTAGTCGDGRCDHAGGDGGTAGWFAETIWSCPEDLRLPRRAPRLQPKLPAHTTVSACAWRT